MGGIGIGEVLQCVSLIVQERLELKSLVPLDESWEYKNMVFVASLWTTNNSNFSVFLESSPKSSFPNINLLSP